MIDAGENTVVAILRFGGRAKLSRIKIDQIMGAVFQISDGKITRAASTRPAPKPSKLRALGVALRTTGSRLTWRAASFGIGKDGAS